MAALRPIGLRRRATTPALAVVLMLAGCTSSTTTTTTTTTTTATTATTATSATSTTTATATATTSTASTNTTPTTTGAASTEPGPTRFTQPRYDERNVKIGTVPHRTAGSYAVPLDGKKHPAVLFIAGSGPTDRNGDSASLPGNIGTLRFLANSISEHMVTLRYDKIGVGSSDRPSKPDEVTLTDFVDQAEEVLTWLASQPEVDPSRITVVGHSEGGLIALLLSERTKTPIANIALISPQPGRYLDVLRDQLSKQVDAGTLTLYDTAMKEMRDTGKLTNFPSDQVLGSLLNKSTAVFLADADQFDPVEAASKLPPDINVLLTCGTTDVQVTCGSLDPMRNALKPRGSAHFTDVILAGTNHVLRVAPTGGLDTYVNDSFPHDQRAATALKALIGYPGQ
jgi:uncharacterized protein